MSGCEAFINISVFELKLLVDMWQCKHARLVGEP